MAVIHRIPARRDGALKETALYVLMALVAIAIAVPAAIATAG